MNMVCLVKPTLSLYPIKSRIHCQDDLLGKYEKAHIVDNDLSNSTLSHERQTDFLMETNTHPNSHSTMKVRTIFYQLK